MCGRDCVVRKKVGEGLSDLRAAAIVCRIMSGVGETTEGLVLPLAPSIPPISSISSIRYDAQLVESMPFGSWFEKGSSSSLIALETGMGCITQGGTAALLSSTMVVGLNLNSSLWCSRLLSRKLMRIAPMSSWKTISSWKTFCTFSLICAWKSVLLIVSTLICVMACTHEPSNCSSGNMQDIPKCMPGKSLNTSACVRPTPFLLRTAFLECAPLPFNGLTSPPSSLGTLTLWLGSGLTGLRCEGWPSLACTTSCCSKTLGPPLLSAFSTASSSIFWDTPSSSSPRSAWNCFL
mmetsp:Transcript_10324/g.19568  ORF Transcript_10324/g.19568 Transcript_10324/m.19568 type:complete len:292 (+) Transcript_10324:449-1324(+)